MKGDYQLLLCLIQELTNFLKARTSYKPHEWFKNEHKKAKLHRLRLSINEVLLRIEREMEDWCKTNNKEKWQ